MMMVYKLDISGEIKWSYPIARILKEDEHSICFEAFFNVDDLDLGYVLFARGDRFIEYFYTDRWYNFYEIYDGDSGIFKGIYGNITRPAQFRDGDIYYEDLALDVWVDPDGGYLLLDEDEFDALELGAEDRRSCEGAVTELIQLLTTRMKGANEG